MIDSPQSPLGAGGVRLARDHDADAIHRLNYRTFVEEIPQHSPSPDGRLVDRFHDENTYAVYEVEGAIVGMIAGRMTRPFSLDFKLDGLDRWLPADSTPVEIRLLAVDPKYRNGRVFAALVRCITEHFMVRGCDVAVISGTTRQLRLYAHLGFVPFGPRVGKEGAWYQPMYVTLGQLRDWSPVIRPDVGANFLPGPVQVSPQVARAFANAPVSHRGEVFRSTYRAVARQLASLVRAPQATLLLGSGTFANDVVAAQLSLLRGPGLILANGEFGERLIDHASRFGISFVACRKPWGAQFTRGEIEHALDESGASWIWFVHCETSTGVLNDLRGIVVVAGQRGVQVAVDVISSVGTIDVDLRGIFLASCVSGKALASYPGLAIVFHDGKAMPSGGLPRYLDLGFAVENDGVPFTHSSNLVDALFASVSEVDWPARFARISNDADELRNMLRAHDVLLLEDAAMASPAVHTIVLPRQVNSIHFGERLRALGWMVSFESGYLRDRNWIQVCFKGAYERTAVASFARRFAVLLQQQETLSERDTASSLPSVYQTIAP